MKAPAVRSGIRTRFIGATATALLVLAGCGSGSGTGTTTGTAPPTAGVKPPSEIGAGEGALNLIAWEGYTDASWVDPFAQQTGCKVHAQFAGSSDEMVTLMANGGGGQWDMVSASGDADLRLIYSGDVTPMNTALIPDYANFQPQFKSPSFNTIDGIHYGISLQWGPNVLLYNTKSFATAPTTWQVLYDPKYSGQITVPDNPIQIADAALYLMKHQASLKITDPYELTQPQFDAAVALLKTQRPLVKKYWGLASQEISLFQNGDVQLGAAWPYQTSTLKAANAPVNDTIPAAEGATGWADTWMMASKAPHPNCAYLWTKYISTPKVQAMQAVNYGETPVNSKACTEMDAIQAGSCAQYHANADASYFATIKFWKTPIATCDDGSQNCIPYAKWQTAWTGITA
jgi:putative spermidine/putrescine transport system substrate-binding protein